MPEQAAPRWDDPSMWDPYGVPKTERVEKWLPVLAEESESIPPEAEVEKPHEPEGEET